MGCYVNPKTETKEAFLLREGQPLSDAPRWSDVPKGMFAVCLIQNPNFTAAGIAFDEKELNVFTRPTERLENWFLVEIRKLWDVSDLATVAPYIDPPLVVPVRK